MLIVLGLYGDDEIILMDHGVIYGIDQQDLLNYSQVSMCMVTFNHNLVCNFVLHICFYIKISKLRSTNKVIKQIYIINNLNQITRKKHKLGKNHIYVLRKGSWTYCVRNVKAALVMLDGKWSPLMISCHNFLLMTSTSPPRAMTRLYSSYRSSTDLAMMGNRLIGVPVGLNKIKSIIVFVIFLSKRL